MNTKDKSNSGRVSSDATNPSQDLAAMDRDALAALVESMFRWALKHTGLTRGQIIAQIRRDEGEP